MSQDLVKGYTNNHLFWAAVDATDGFTPESALSAITKIRVYGKLKGATGVNFVASGTGSMTNDIQHVGPSVFGLYTLALAKADLSDASAAWYDKYAFIISAAGAAPITIVADGGIMASHLSALVSRMSDVQSYLAGMSGMLSDTHSAAILGASHASDALSAANVGASRALLIQSRLSDFNSAMVSDISDIRSMLTHLSDAASNAYSAAAQGNSRILLVQSRLSDLDSRLVSDVSDIRSAIAGITVTISASDLSDIASAVVAATGSTLSDIQSYLAAMSGMLSDTHSAAILAASHASDALSAAGVGNSRILLVQSRLSDLDSRLVSDVSDIRSAIAGITVSISASDVSDIASAVIAGLSGEIATASDVASKVWAEKYTAASNVKASTFGSMLRLNMSRLSDVQSYLAAMSGMLSDTHSAAILGASHASDALSAANVGASRALVIQSRLSDFNSAMVSDISDIRSMLTHLSDAASNAYSAAVVGASRALVIQSRLSDLDSRLVSDVSDIRSAIAGITVSISASDISDIASATAAAVGFTPSAISAKVWSDFGSKVGATPSQVYSVILSDSSRLSDLASYVAAMSGALSDAHSAAAQGASRALVVQSRLSDLDSRLVSDVSDLRSAIAGITVSISASDISDIASAVAVGVGFGPAEIADKVWSDFASKTGATPSQLYSVLNLAGSRVSDLQSYLAGMSGMLSDAHSAAAQASSRAQLAASHASDAHSAIQVTQSMVSDVGSFLTSMSGMLSDAHSAAAQASSRALVAASAASDAHSAVLVTQSMVSDVDSALSSQFLVEASSLSDIYSATLVAQSHASDALSAARLAASHASDVYSALTTARPEPGQGTPAASLDMLGKLDYLYKAWRNRSTQTATEYALYADDGVTKDHEAAVSDDGTTFVRGEISTGA